MAAGSPPPRSAGEPWLVGLLLALVVTFGFLTLSLLRYKHFTIDEFQYAHAAWLVAQGQIPYRDFFDDRFPLLYQIFGTLPALKTARPEDIMVLRWMMLPILLATLGAHAYINKRRGSVTSLLGVVFLLCTWNFSTRATEIRPDSLAFALVLASVALLGVEGLGDRLAAFVAGVLVGASLWASLKVAVYGIVFAVGLLIDQWINRPRRQRLILRHDGLLVAGFAVTASLVFTYLIVSGSLSDWFTWSVKWAYVHEAHYPRVPWVRTSAPFLLDYWWLVVIGAIGWLNDLLPSGELPQTDPRETLLLLLVPSTLLSFVAQRAPFEYSLIPFIGVLTIYAARGLVFLFRTAWRYGPTPRAIAVSALSVICAYGLVLSFIRLQQAVWPTVNAQLETLHQLGIVTNPTDAVYDNTGAYFARPHAWYFFYTDEVLRNRLSGIMNSEVQQALLRSKAPAVLMDLRFRGLPAPLQLFIVRHYQSYGGDIRLWGMRYGPAPGVDQSFQAIQSGRYFVEPADVLAAGTLTIDGQRIASQIFNLNAGDHRVLYAGRPVAFSILWLPRNGTPYTPGITPSQSLFSIL